MSTTEASWRIRVGEHGWVREVVDGHGPIVTAVEAEAYQWPTREAAEQAVAPYPRPVTHRIVPGPATPRAFFKP